MAESNEEPPQKKPKFDGGPMFDSLKLAFEVKSQKVFYDCYEIFENTQGNFEVKCKNCEANLGMNSKNAAYNLTVNLSSLACSSKLSVEKHTSILLAKLPGGILDACYQILKNGDGIEVHCKCCRDYGIPKIMIASAQNIASNMQQHGDSKQASPGSL